MRLKQWSLVSLLIAGVVAGAILMATLNSEVAAQSDYQTWQMSFSSSSGTYTGILHVKSSGSFTSSGFYGSTSQGSYPISIEGQMSGDSITFYETAVYDGGSGEIYAYCSDGYLNVEFPYATYASGTLDGTISDPLGSRDFSMSWSATKTSGSSNGGDDDGYVYPDNYDSSLDFSWVVPVVIAGVVGTIVVATIVAVALYMSSKKPKQNSQYFTSSMPQQHWGREQHPTNPQYGEASSGGMQGGPGIQGSLYPSPITMDNGIPITGAGISVGSTDLSGLPFLNALWSQNLAKLKWGTPQYDPTKYRLVGYDISQQIYGPNSTSAQSAYLARVPAGTNAVNQPFHQTYRWNTSGDIAGYRVDPVYSPIDSSGQAGSQFRFGGLGIRINEAIGTFGIGP